MVLKYNWDFVLSRSVDFHIYIGLSFKVNK